MTERQMLLLWGAACVVGALIVDHRAVIAVGVCAMGLFAIWLSNQEGR